MSFKVCNCTKCQKPIAFDAKQVGQVVACPECRQDTKLYTSDKVAQPEKASGFDSGRCDGAQIDVLWIDHVAYALEHPKAQAELARMAQATQPKPAPIVPPPLLATPQAPPVIKHGLWHGFPGLWVAVALGGVVACALLVQIVTPVFNWIGYHATYKTRNQHATEKLIRDMANEYGSRDHMQGRKRTKDQVDSLAWRLHVHSDEYLKQFEDAYDQGWGSVGRY